MTGINCSNCDNELTPDEVQSCQDADSEWTCDKCLHKWADSTLVPLFQDAPKVQVILPLHQGDTSTLPERVWCQLLTGDETAGTGVVLNVPVACGWVKYGDRVTFEEIYPGQAPFAPIVTAVVPR